MNIAAPENTAKALPFETGATIQSPTEGAIYEMHEVI
jgi:hypothetical protein